MSVRVGECMTDMAVISNNKINLLSLMYYNTAKEARLNFLFILTSEHSKILGTQRS